MKYNFDSVHDRVNDPESYSLKYQMYVDDLPLAQGMGFPKGVVPADTISLYHADMDFDCAPEITEAIHKAADFPNYGYSAPRKPYYEAVSRWFRVHYDWNFGPSDVYECSGTHAGVAEAVKTFTHPGSGVMIFTPSYPFDGDIRPAGRQYVKIPFIENEDTTFRIDWPAFEKEARKPENEALIIVQPHNPLGFAYSVEDMKKMAQICRENNVIMIADMVHLDIHRKNVHPVPFMKAVGPENVVAMTGLAKTFNIAGLNMSNMIICDPNLKTKLGWRYVAMTPFGIAAATAAYTRCDEWVEQLNEYIDGLCEYACGYFAENMPKLRFTRPEASYVMYLDFRGYGLTSAEIDQRVAQKAHIALSNGEMYGAEDGDLWRRFCLTSPKPVIAEALDRMKKAFADIEG